MRLNSSLFLLLAILLTSCANQGVIVRKDSRAHPFYNSVGIEGVYTFILRDNTGATHRQMVTPDVYSHYAIGDYFNDQASPALARDVSDPKTARTTTMTAARRPTFDLRRTASKPTAAKKTQQVASTSRTSRVRSASALKKPATKQIASNSARTKARTKQHVASRKTSAKKVATKMAQKSRHRLTQTKAAEPRKLTAPALETASVVTQSLPPFAVATPVAEGPGAVPDLPAPFGEPEIVFVHHGSP